MGNRRNSRIPGAEGDGRGVTITATTAITCHGPAYRRCHNVVDVEHASIPSVNRIGGKRPLTKQQVLAAAICDDCARLLTRRGAELYPLADTLAAIEKREQDAKPTASLGELLVTSSLLRDSRRAIAERAREEEKSRRQANAVQAARLIAAVQTSMSVVA